MKVFSYLSATIFAAVTVLAVHSQAETLKLDKKNSIIEWKGTKAVGSAHNGTVQLKTGELMVEAGKPVSGSAVADMKTIKDLDLSGEWNKKLITHLNDTDFFDTKKHPTSEVKITKIQPVKDNIYFIQGDLTIKGKSLPFSKTATLSEDTESKKVIVADFTIDRTAYDIKYGSGKFFENLGDKMINDEINLKANLVFTK